MIKFICSFGTRLFAEGKQRFHCFCQVHDICSGYKVLVQTQKEIEFPKPSDFFLTLNCHHGSSKCDALRRNAINNFHTMNKTENDSWKVQALGNLKP